MLNLRGVRAAGRDPSPGEVLLLVLRLLQHHISPQSLRAAATCRWEAALEGSEGLQEEAEPPLAYTLRGFVAEPLTLLPHTALPITSSSGIVPIHSGSVPIYLLYP